MRGLLTQSGNPLIIVSILPTAILALALAFSPSSAAATAWAGACIGLQLMQLIALNRLQQRALGRGRLPAGESAPQSRIVFHTDIPDYSHAEVLHSEWWRSTTADALTAGRPAYGYFFWQHTASRGLQSLLKGRPACPAGRLPVA